MGSEYCQLAKCYSITASEIIFTSGGTEADNLILQNAVLNLNVKRIVTSKIEHHAVLHTCNHLTNREKFYRCIVCKRKALVNLMAMRNRFVRELYEHVYRAKDFSTMERGNRGTEQRAMEQKVLNPSTTLPSDLRGSMSPCPCLGLDYRCCLSRS